MFAPKIAEVKWMLIGLQDLCIGQTSDDWLSRDKQASEFRKYHRDMENTDLVNPLFCAEAER